MEKIKYLQLLQAGSKKNEHKKEILDLAQKFGILTEDCSFLVLTSLAEYLKYNIVPDKIKATKIYQEYVKHKEEMKKKKLERIKTKLNKIGELWIKRMEFLQKKFPRPLSSEEKKYERGSGKSGERFG